MTAILFPPRTTGTSGSHFYSGNGTPDPSLGTDGDVYLNRANPSLYGPKLNGAWGTPIPLGGTTVVSHMESTEPYTVVQPGVQTINLPVSNPDYIEMYLNGQLQPENLFSVSGAVATVSADLGAAIDDKIEFAYETVSSVSAGDAPIPMDEVPTGATDGQNTTFTLSYAPISNTLNVYVNGLRADADDYTLSGNTITFNLPPNRKVRATYER